MIGNQPAIEPGRRATVLFVRENLHPAAPRHRPFTLGDLSGDERQELLALVQDPPAEDENRVQGHPRGQPIELRNAVAVGPPEPDEVAEIGHHRGVRELDQLDRRQTHANRSARKRRGREVEHGHAKGRRGEQPELEGLFIGFVTMFDERQSFGVTVGLRFDQDPLPRRDRDEEAPSRIRRS